MFDYDNYKNHQRIAKPQQKYATDQRNWSFSKLIIRSADTELGRWKLVVAAINVDAYHFRAVSDLTCPLEHTGIGVFWLHFATW